MNLFLTKKQKEIYMLKIIRDKLIEDNNPDDCACVLCGESNENRKANGQVFHGLFVCEDCIEYIVNLDLEDTSA